MQQQRQQQKPISEQAQDITAMNANLVKLKAIMTDRVPPMTIAPINKVAVTTNYDDEDGVVKYTRDGLDKLTKQRGLKLSTNDTSNDGYFNNLFFMFQIYIALIQHEHQIIDA